MVFIGRISEIKRDEYDYAFAIVRSMKRKSDWIVQVPELSPSTQLFFAYRNLAQSNNWNADTFQQMYVPQFLHEMHSPAAREWLNRIWRYDRAGKRVALCCFCEDESLCHRSIVGGMLMGVGCDVRFSSGKAQDFEKYYALYKAAV